MMDWRPIESAPRDGTAILAWPIEAVYGAPEEVNIAYVLRYDTERHCWREAAGEQYERYEPTHWQPVPAPPVPR